MAPTPTAFEELARARARGQARDMRVRWALEEVGQRFETLAGVFRWVKTMKEAAHRKLHPFGQIPTYEEGDLALFESGSIILHIAQGHAGLLPKEASARARAITWMFAALNTLEPPIVNREMAEILEREKTVVQGTSRVASMSASTSAWMILLNGLATRNGLIMRSVPVTY